MYTSTGSTRRSGSQGHKSYRSFIWVSGLLSLAVVFFGMQLMMVGPLKGRLEGIQAQLDQSDETMRKLVAERNELWRTNDLLSGLQQQAAYVESIRDSIESIGGLRQHVQREADATRQALASFQTMSQLQQQLAAQQRDTEVALAQLDDLITLRQSLIDTARDTEDAVQALAQLGAVKESAIDGGVDVAQAEHGIQTLADLKYRVIGEADTVTQADESLDRMAALNRTLIEEGSQVADAQASADQLVAMQDQLVASQPALEAAADAASQLLVMNDSLAGVETSAASDNLDGLIDLESRLGSRGDHVAQAVRTLEILDDFQNEVDDHVRSIEGIRRTMVEIAMLESSVGRAARVLQPLIEIGNLRRLGDREVREAARVILDQRAARPGTGSRLVQSPERTVDQSSTPVVDDAGLVPYPPESFEDAE